MFVSPKPSTHSKLKGVLNIVSWDREGHYHYSKMILWEPEGCYWHRHCTMKVPFWFPMEHLWILIVPFWLSADNIISFHKCLESPLLPILSMHWILSFSPLELFEIFLIRAKDRIRMCSESESEGIGLEESKLTLTAPSHFHFQL